MTWLQGNGRETRPAGERLRDLIGRDEILRVPGAHNAFAGAIAKDAGFEALYISGGAVTASMGLPDLGIIGLDELCGVVRSVSRTTDLPLAMRSSPLGNPINCRAREGVCFCPISANFGNTEATWEDGDFDGNGRVELADYRILAENFGKSRQGVVAPSLSAASQAAEILSAVTISAAEDLFERFDDELSLDNLL